MSQLGCDVVYPTNKILPVDLDTAKTSVVGPALGLDPSEIDLEEIIGEGIVNRVFLVKSGGTPQAVLKVLPSYSFWKKRKCENEVCAMEIARKILKLSSTSTSTSTSTSASMSTSSVDIPTVIKYESDSSKSPILREYILMSFAPGKPLSRFGEDHPLHKEIDSLVSDAENKLEAFRFQEVGHFTKDVNGEVIVGPQIECKEAETACDLREFSEQLLKLSIDRTRKWLTQEKLENIGYTKIEDKLRNFICDFASLPVNMFDIPIGFLHDDLQDSNVLVQLSESVSTQTLRLLHFLRLLIFSRESQSRV